MRYDILGSAIQLCFVYTTKQIVDTRVYVAAQVCLNAACEGGNRCSIGYGGTACLFCDDGLILSDTFQCSECVPVLQMVLILCIVIIVMALLMRFELKEENILKKASDYSVALKIFLSTLSMNAIANNYAFAWDERISSLFDTQTQVRPPSRDRVRFLSIQLPHPVVQLSHVLQLQSCDIQSLHAHG